MNRFAYRPIVSSPRLVRLTDRLACELLPTYRAMATASSSPLGPAPWRQLFLEHVQTMASPEFTLSTIRKTSSPSSGTVYYSPRARTCVFRGLFAGLPANPKNEAELNPDVYETDFPTFTTDCRMDKMAELFGTEETGEKLRGSGGGAPVEAVFWARETGTQWRVRGKAYVLAPDVEDSEEGKRVISTLTARMRRKDASQGGWSFAREVTAHFGNMAPLMRGSFRSPPPGAPVALPVDDDRLKLGQKVTDLEDEVARANFRVVVIVPEGVDRTDLSDPERGRRWLYTFVGDKSEPTAPGGVVQDGWEEVEVWP
ncbi:pyridoxamine 5'-phosphate oxidase-domain-containing protein [Daldinia vernicosa]|uniref:pyridoxamine 5'-phosphate oxidase-domain-containing protein n=1 Tax=Daldinia vernicosa TaxID=114800 RepID=UPI0020072320|nr:pyridoxamine 5'-phosphate oxidase-domain-containing protein [Daldinia vernicosa]KAI0844072.1 pyridoxamine 5'-phosphate oxidase-domain-containing protein [Daldinia vernicosa]